MHFALGEFIESMNINISRITGFIALSQFLCASSLFLGLKQTIRGFSPVFSKCHEFFRGTTTYLGIALCNAFGAISKGSEGYLSSLHP